VRKILEALLQEEMKRQEKYLVDISKLEEILLKNL
jgi:hypothetical protein